MSQDVRQRIETAISWDRCDKLRESFPSLWLFGRSIGYRDRALKQISDL
jgi:hypothetical protein